jgi:hypothetical protein
MEYLWRDDPRNRMNHPFVTHVNFSLLLSQEFPRFPKQMKVSDGELTGLAR